MAETPFETRYRRNAIYVGKSTQVQTRLRTHRMWEQLAAVEQHGFPIYSDIWVALWFVNLEPIRRFFPHTMHGDISVIEAALKALLQPYDDGEAHCSMGPAWHYRAPDAWISARELALGDWSRIWSEEAFARIASCRPMTSDPLDHHWFGDCVYAWTTEDLKGYHSCLQAYSMDAAMRASRRGIA